MSLASRLNVFTLTRARRAFRASLPARLVRALTLTLSAHLLLASAVQAAATGDNGAISGTVANAATGNLLEGARIELPQLGFSALTDNTGRFHLDTVPAGAHTVVVSYTGLDAARREIEVAPGQRVTTHFDLTTSIYQLEKFKVTGEREGGAAAITAQRNADNVKNIVAIDSLGNLPNLNASELAVRLPGVAGNLSDEGNVVGFTIRGMGPGLNTITVDGALMSSQGGMSRQTRIHTITGAMFDQLELTKGHTPDKGADSLGGTVNLKSRSPLSMKEKRRVTYNFSGRIAPSFTQQIPLREQHRAHPLLNVAYQEVFDTFGGERNLGVSVNLFYSEQAVGFFRTTRDFQNTTSTPAYVWDYRTMDNYNNRKQSSVNAKFDYRLSPTTKLSLNTIYNDAFERFRLRYEVRAFTGNQNTVPGAASGIIPGYTDRITQVRATPGSTIDVTSQMSNFYNRLRHVDVGVEQEFGPLQLDYNAVFSRTHINSGGGDGGVLVNRITNVGWILDRTESDLYPRFVQTDGPDFTNPANYRPNSLNFADTKNDHEVKEVRANIRYKLPTRFDSSFKTGIRWREESATDVNRSRRYNYLGTSALPSDPTIVTFDQVKTGSRIPLWNANAISVNRQPVNAALWSEDRYFREQSKYTGTRGVTETVSAAYVMAQGKIGATSLLSGVRVEKTEDESWGWVRAKNGSSAADQAADPIGSAQRDYANTRRELRGSYTKAFPSVHLTHDLSRNLKARVSWSTSFGRPSMNNLLPNETANDTAQTLTINNPGLLPQSGRNWDATLDYYFEPVGNISVGWFHKTIKDYIISGVNAGTVPSGANNGYGGDYSSYTLLTSSNAGTAYVQGWELSYQQQFTFLPGFLKGFGAFANYTAIEVHGDFGGTTNLTTDQVAGFVPRTGNVGLSWRHRGFNARALVNYTGDYISSYSAGSVGRNLYVRKRTTVNLGLAYEIRPSVSLTLDVGNLFNEPQVLYRGVRDQMQSTIIPGTTLTLGLSGRF